MNWQPIETAPKDGTEVLLWYPDLRRGMHFGRWHDEARVEFGKEVSSTRRWLAGDIMLMELHSGKTFEPTHWMLIPDAPTKPNMSVAHHEALQAAISDALSVDTGYVKEEI